MGVAMAAASGVSVPVAVGPPVVVGKLVRVPTLLVIEPMADVSAGRSVVRSLMSDEAAELMELTSLGVNAVQAPVLKSTMAG